MAAAEKGESSAELPPPTASSIAQGEPSHRLDAPDFDIPVGWFGLGGQRDVPANACYVGCYKGRYAWVTPDGVDGLAQFTLAVLTVTKLEAGEAGSASGMMFIP